MLHNRSFRNSMIHMIYCIIENYNHDILFSNHIITIVIPAISSNEQKNCILVEIFYETTTMKFEFSEKRQNQTEHSQGYKTT